MELNPVYKAALYKLGFNDESVSAAIALAKSDVIETDDDFVDFVNFNIEDGKFPYLTSPFSKKALENALDKGRKAFYLSNRLGINVITYSDSRYPKNIKTYEDAIDSFTAPDMFLYAGNVDLLKKKTVLITGTNNPTDAAKYSSKYFANLMSQEGYNVITGLAPGCEQLSFEAIQEKNGPSSILYTKNLQMLSSRDINMVFKSVQQKRTLCLSFAEKFVVDLDKNLENRNKLLAVIADCVIVPQVGAEEIAFKTIKYFIEMHKPVFFVDYNNPDDQSKFQARGLLKILGAEPISSENALHKIKKALSVPPRMKKSTDSAYLKCNSRLIAKEFANLYPSEISKN